MIQIGENRFTIDRFGGDKAIRVLECVAEIANACDLGRSFAALNQKDCNQAAEVSALVPVVLRKGRPLFFRALAISLLTEKEMARLDDTALETRIAELVTLLRTESDLDQLLEIAKAAYQAIGLKNAKKLLPSLVSDLRKWK